MEDMRLTRSYVFYFIINAVGVQCYDIRNVLFFGVFKLLVFFVCIRINFATDISLPQNVRQVRNSISISFIKKKAQW